MTGVTEGSWITAQGWTRAHLARKIQFECSFAQRPIEKRGWHTLCDSTAKPAIMADAEMAKCKKCLAIEAVA